jgi:hypothetical protein
MMEALSFEGTKKEFLSDDDVAAYGTHYRKNKGRKLKDSTN